ncbi:MAG: hypothetical protein PWQ91_1485 [Eubacteriales bacterium]|nr:hypothetical protein [Eubacteriales bacterium]
MEQIDARGKPCPQPVVLTKKAIDAGATALEVLVDNPQARDNVLQLARNLGWQAEVQETDGGYRLVLQKRDEGEKAADPMAGITCPGGRDSTRTVLLLTSNTMGRGSEELGQILIRSFFYTLVEAEKIPSALYLVNSGVKIACEGSELLDHLRALAERGMEIRVCGTCLDYFQLKEKLKVGQVTNMYAIWDALAQADKVITL